MKDIIPTYRWAIGVRFTMKNHGVRPCSYPRPSSSSLTLPQQSSSTSAGVEDVAIAGLK